MKKVEGILYSDNSRVSIEIGNGIIQKVSKIKNFDNEASAGQYIAPALFDNQVNGYVDIEFSKPDLSVDDMLRVVREHHKNGVISFMPTVITGSFESLSKSFANLAKSLQNAEVAYSVPGFHLERLYISTVKGFYGAHGLEDVRKPDWNEFQKLNETADGKIIQVTLAPEVEGAIEFIKKCVKNNIVVSLGHHNGNAEDIERAADAGAKTVTHIGNGMANNINRFENPL